MGIRMYTASPRYVAEWRSLVAGAGCKVDENDDVHPGLRVLCDSGMPCEWLRVTISGGGERADLQFEINQDFPWGCALLPPLGNLSTCLAAQMVAAGGNYFHGGDLLQQATVWCDVQVPFEKLFNAVLPKWDASFGQLTLHREWGAKTDSAVLPYGQTTFTSFLLKLGSASTPVWFGPSVGGGFFLAYRIETGFFKPGHLLHLEFLLRSELCRRGARCVRDYG